MELPGFCRNRAAALVVLLLCTLAPAVAAARDAGIIAAGGPGEILVTWDRVGFGDALYYLVYRAENRDPDLEAEPFEMVKGPRFVDTQVTPGIEYRYAVIGVDRGGARRAVVGIGVARAAAGGGPRLAGITVEPQGRPLRASDVVTVTVVGQSGAQATVDLGELAVPLVLKEKGRTGRYTGSYVVKAADLGGARRTLKVVAHLADASGTSDLAGPQIEIAARGALADRTPPVIAKASHDAWKVAGFSGKLVAGDVLTVTVEGEAGAEASVSLTGLSGSHPLKEIRPGYYTGTYAVRWTDQASEAPVVVRLTDAAGNQSRTVAGRPLALDTRVRLSVAPANAALPPDGRSQTRIVVHAENANGDEVSGHLIDVTPIRTEEVASVAAERRGSREGDSRVSLQWHGITDAFGDATATFTAGRSGGRTLLLAKDLTTGDVGVGWVDSEDLTGGTEARSKTAVSSRLKASRVPANAARPELRPEHPGGAPAVSELELRRAYGALFVPSPAEDQPRERYRVAEWLAQPNDRVEKGQPLAVVETRGARRSIAAPARGVLLKSLVRVGDRVDIGDILGYVEIDADVWSREYARRR